VRFSAKSIFSINSAKGQSCSTTQAYHNQKKSLLHPLSNGIKFLLKTFNNFVSFDDNL